MSFSVLNKDFLILEREDLDYNAVFLLGYDCVNYV